MARTAIWDILEPSVVADYRTEYRVLLAREREYLTMCRRRGDTFQQGYYCAASCARIGRYLRILRAIDARLHACTRPIGGDHE